MSLFRKVQTESSTGSSNSYRVRTTLKICVESIDFDTQACVLRLKGRNIEENKYVKVNKIIFHVSINGKQIILLEKIMKEQLIQEKDNIKVIKCKDFKYNKKIKHNIILAKTTCV